MTLRRAILLAATAVGFYFLTGCKETRAESQEHRQRSGTAQFRGVVGAWPLDLTVQTDSTETASGQQNSRTEYDLAKLAQAAAESALARYGIAPGATSSPGMDPTTIATGTGAIVSTLALIAKLLQEIKYHQRDAAEGWARAISPTAPEKGDPK